MGAAANLEANPWLLALIVDDVSAIKVATAFYSLPRGRRRDLDDLAELSGVTQDVQAVLARLDAAGVLSDGQPPDVLVRLISTWVSKQIKK